MYLQRTTLEHFDHVVKVVDAPVVLQHQGHTSRQRRKHWLPPNSLSWSRERHLRCDAATGANVPEGEKHDRNPTGAIHDGSPLAPLRDGEVDFPAVPQHQVPTIQTIQRRSRLLKSSSLVDESMPRERHGPPREAGPGDPQGCCRPGLQLPVIQKPKDHEDPAGTVH